MYKCNNEFKAVLKQHGSAWETDKPFNENVI